MAYLAKVHLAGKGAQENSFFGCSYQIFSRFARCDTARGFSTGLFLVGPTKVKACTSFMQG